MKDSSTNDQPPNKRRKLNADTNITDTNITNTDITNTINNNNHNHNSHNGTIVPSFSTIKKEKTQQKSILYLREITKWHPRTFTIKGKFTYISEVEYKGKFDKKAYFYALFMDAKSTEMKINFWAELVEEWTKKKPLKKNVIYEIYGLAPKQQPPRFRQYGEIELNCTRTSTFTPKEINEDDEEDEDDDLKILNQNWNFTPNIIGIKEKSEYEIIDVIGVISRLEDATTQFTRKNPDTPIRRIEIADETAKISATIWNSQTKIPLKLHQIAAFKAMMVKNYGGKTLTLVGHIEIKPEHTRADELELWLKRNNGTTKVIIDGIQSITKAETSLEDYKDASEITCQDALKKQQIFRVTQKMPKITHYKVKGAICDVDSQLFHYKGGKPSWALKIRIMDIDEHNFKAICFEEVGAQIMKGYSGEQAADLQCKSMDTLLKLIQNIIERGQQRVFSIRCKQNTYWANKKTLDYIVDEVQDC